MAIKLGPGDRLVIRGATPAPSQRSRFGPVKSQLRQRIKELKENANKTGPRWYERALVARGRLAEVRALLAWISKEEKRQE